MKILFHYPTPFALEQNERTFQIVRLREALIKLGVEVEYLRWYDDRQTGDIYHYFGRLSPDSIHLARNKGMKIVMAESLAQQAAFSPVRKWLDHLAIQFLRRALGHRGTTIFTWNSYHLADAFIAATPVEGQLMTGLYDAPAAKVHFIGGQDFKKAAAELKNLYEKLLRGS